MNETNKMEQKHLLDVIAERLGCKSRDELKQSAYSIAAKNELFEGKFESMDMQELADTLLFISPPLKAILYGTEENEAM